jgi:hypothetical protein
MPALGQGRDLVEDRLSARDDETSAHRVKATAALGALGLGDRVGAVERVVQAAPARIGGIKGVAGIGDGHHELRAGERRNFRIDAARRDGERRRLGLEVADAGEEGAIGRCIDRAGAMLFVPGVDRSLHFVALQQQRPVHRGEIMDDRREASPESARIEPGAGQRLIPHKVMQGLGDPKGACVDIIHAQAFSARVVGG